MSLIKPKQATAKTVYLAWADTTSGSQRVGSGINVEGLQSIVFFLKFVRRSGTALTSGWPRFRIEGSPSTAAQDTTNTDWTEVYPYVPAVGASIANTTLSASASIGATSLTVSAITNIGNGDILFVQGNTDAENEIVRVKGTPSGSTVNLDDGTPLQFAHNSGRAVTDQAEIPPGLPFGCELYKRFRVVIDNTGSGQTIATEVEYLTCDAYEVA